MKKFSFLIATLFYYLIAIAQPQDSWEQKQSLGLNTTIKSYAVSFSIGDKGYVGPDGNHAYTQSHDFCEYDPATDVWTQKADFPGATRQSAAGFSIGNKGYLGTGRGYSSMLNDFWEYDPASNSWTQKRDFPGNTRSDATTFTIGNKGYLGTGYNSGSLKDFWEYEPITDTWMRKADFAGIARGLAVGISIGNKGYIGTGETFNNGFHGLKDFWEYDPVTDMWARKPDFPGTARVGAVGFSIGNKGYLGTGTDSNFKYQKDFWEYDPAADKWQQIADFGGSNATGATAFTIGNLAYIGCYDGVLKTSANNLWEYNPATDTWTQRKTLQGGARYSAVGFSIGDKGYVGTGSGKKDFWEYDPVNGTWTQKADFAGGERSGAVGFGIGNKGYVGTGSDLYNVQKKDFWEYDPVTNQWRRKADFDGAERDNAIGFSISGKGYIGTGFRIYNGNRFLSDFWEYDPVADKWIKKADFPAQGRYSAIGFGSSVKGYVGTGLKRDNTTLTDFWEYDPANDKWKRKADFPGERRSGAVSFIIGNKGYIGTGKFLKDFWEYDITSDQWMQKADFAGGNRTSAVGFSIGSKGFVGLGLKTTQGYGPVPNDWWQYNPFEGNEISAKLSNNIACLGSAIVVRFFATGTYNEGNVFTAQLSDVNGRFSKPVDIGSVTSTTDSVINAIIPNSIPAATLYRIRVVASNPKTIGYTVPGYVTLTSSPINFYRDADGDGFGDALNMITTCSPPDGYVANNADCNDNDASIHPEALEAGDGKDNNCNGRIDENVFIQMRVYNNARTEPDWKNTTIPFYIEINHPLENEVRVDYATQDNTATSPEDYIATSGTAVFAPGEKLKKINVIIKGDLKYEDDETFYFVIKNPFNAAIRDSIAVGIIRNNDAADIATVAATNNAVNNTPENKAIKLSPNPASGKVIVSLTGYMGNTSIRLNDMQGKLLQERRVQLLTKSAFESFDISKYTNGIYYVTVFDEKGSRQTVKLVIQR